MELKTESILMYESHQLRKYGWIINDNKYYSNEIKN